MSFKINELNKIHYFMYIVVIILSSI